MGRADFAASVVSGAAPSEAYCDWTRPSDIGVCGERSGPACRPAAATVGTEQGALGRGELVH